VIGRLVRSRGFRRVGWAYVAFWILSSGFLTAAILFEALIVRHARTFGGDIKAYVIATLGFPLIVPAMTLVGGIPGDAGERPVAVWGLTVATLAWAIAGWWTLGAAVWRRWSRWGARGGPPNPPTLRGPA
jgi:hypothetical protein